MTFQNIFGKNCFKFVIQICFEMAKELKDKFEVVEFHKSIAMLIPFKIVFFSKYGSKGKHNSV